MEQRSLTDELTGLGNRRYLTQHLPKDIDALLRRRHDKQTPHSDDDEALLFFLIDLDHFKWVNDHHGHTAGDLVLNEIRKILLQVFRESDHLVRWGGEEFLVVVRFAKRSEAPHYAERLRTAVEQYVFQIDPDTPLSRTCSIGFSSYPCFASDPQRVTWAQVIDIADLCLYAAKKSRRNAWVGLDFYHVGNESELFPALMSDPRTVLARSQPRVLSSLHSTQALVWH
jgi:diguanylate cyclase (GGDEF)-like protein